MLRFVKNNLIKLLDLTAENCVYCILIANLFDRFLIFENLSKLSAFTSLREKFGSVHAEIDRSSSYIMHVRYQV